MVLVTQHPGFILRVNSEPAAQASAYHQGKLEAWLLLFVLLFCGYFFFPCALGNKTG